MKRYQRPQRSRVTDWLLATRWLLATPCLLATASTVTGGICYAQSTATPDRTTCFAPVFKYPDPPADVTARNQSTTRNQSDTEKTGEFGNAEQPLSRKQSSTQTAAQSHSPARAFAAGIAPDGPAGGIVDQPEQWAQTANVWQLYCQLWQLHSRQPDDRDIRRYFGLPLSIDSEHHDWRMRRSRAAPRWLNWPGGTYRQIDTSHFTIYSRAGSDISQQVASTLEQCYWVWTQMFFPLWEGASQVTQHLGQMSTVAEAKQVLARSSMRIAVPEKLTVVLFDSARAYQLAIGQDQPGVQQSTGFYSNDRETTFLVADRSNAATLRHELVHQLFRQATRSHTNRSHNNRLQIASQGGRGGQPGPGEQRDFWLVEGVAGYFESMDIQPGGRVTLGGWDSPRLQYARYRVLAGGDLLPMDQLRREGRLSVQSRQDLARWYAHAIARTHQWIDGGDAVHRRWIYRKLAELYDIGYSHPEPPSSAGLTQPLAEFLTVSDADLQTQRSTRVLEELCLSRCRVTGAGLSALPPCDRLRWLDLSGLPIGTGDLRRLVPDPKLLQRISLEATVVDANLASWLEDAPALSEVDLSWTRCGDNVVSSLAERRLSTLWLTGSLVSDRSLETLVGIRSLKNLDVQRTRISKTRQAELSNRRPELNFNPLQLVGQ